MACDPLGGRVRPLPSPYDDIAAGRPASIALAGPALLGSRLLTKDLAFTSSERDQFALRGLLPDRVLTIEDQVELELEVAARERGGEMQSASPAAPK